MLLRGCHGINTRYRCTRNPLRMQHADAHRYYELSYTYMNLCDCVMYTYICVMYTYARGIYNDTFAKIINA